MSTAILISPSSITREHLAAALPQGWSLFTCPTWEAANRYLASSEAQGQNPLALLAEFDGEWRIPRRVSEWLQKGSKLVAILSDPLQRDLCFQAGAQDYLLKPLHMAEIRSRLLSLAPQAPNSQVQPATPQLERLASIGRLTSHICHEITNPMQAIRGATALALEEADIPETLKIYLDLCQHEAQRVIAMVERMRQLYRPDNRRLEPVQLGIAWSEAISAAWEELEGGQVVVTADFAPDLPPVVGNPDQIFLAFLGILLEASDLLRAQGGGALAVFGDMLDGSVRFQVSIDPKKGVADGEFAPSEAGAGAGPPATALRLAWIETILAAHQGKIEIGKPGQAFVMQVLIPTFPKG